MKPYNIIGALCLLAGVAVATEWVPIFGSTDGKWDIRRGSATPRELGGKLHHTAYVRVTSNAGDETTFMAAVPMEHCGLRNGDVLLLTLGGTVLMASVFTHGDGSTGAMLAKTLCRVK